MDNDLKEQMQEKIADDLESAFYEGYNRGKKDCMKATIKMYDEHVFTTIEELVNFMRGFVE